MQIFCPFFFAGQPQSPRRCADGVFRLICFDFCVHRFSGSLIFTVQRYEQKSIPDTRNITGFFIFLPRNITGFFVLAAFITVLPLATI